MNWDQRRDDLARNGFTVVPGLLAPGQVDGLRQRVDRLFDSDRPKSKQVLYVDRAVPAGTPHLDRLMHQWLNPRRFPAAEGTSPFLGAPAQAARELLGADPVLFQDLLLIKEPGQQRFPMHQDFPFWPVDQPRAVVCWTPLVENEVCGGGLAFSAGSHRLGVQPVVDLHRGGPQDADATLPDLTDFPLTCPSLGPGDALLFNPLVFHGSAARASPGRRAAWSSCWLHPSVRWMTARAPRHPLCQHIQDGAPVG